MVSGLGYGVGVGGGVGSRGLGGGGRLFGLLEGDGECWLRRGLVGWDSSVGFGRRCRREDARDGDDERRSGSGTRVVRLWCRELNRVRSGGRSGDVVVRVDHGGGRGWRVCSDRLGWCMGFVPIQIEIGRGGGLDLHLSRRSCILRIRPRGLSGLSRSG